MEPVSADLVLFSGTYYERYAGCCYTTKSLIQRGATNLYSPSANAHVSSVILR